MSQNRHTSTTLILSHPTKVKAHSISISAYGAEVWGATAISITRSKSISQFKSCLRKTLIKIEVWSNIAEIYQ